MEPLVASPIDPESTGSARSYIVETLTDMRELSFEFLIICVFLAVLTMILVEWGKSWRLSSFHMYFFNKWRRDLKMTCEAELKEAIKFSHDDNVPPEINLEHALKVLSNSDEELRDDKSFPTLRSYAFSLHRTAFMRRVENYARTVLNAPKKNPMAFYGFTSGASLTVRLSAVWDSYELNSPSYDDNAKLDDNRAELNEALEYNLDTLQLTLSHEWVSLVRWMSIYTGTILSISSFLIMWLANRSVTFALIDSIFIVILVPTIGIISGFGASIMHDILRCFTDCRRHSY